MFGTKEIRLEHVSLVFLGGLKWKGSFFVKQFKLPEYECIIFDVDDTLYPPNSGLSEQCTKNIKEYMIQKLGMEESQVPELCHQLYGDYGTTMAGLKAIGYNFDDDDYHRFVHGGLPYEFLKPDPVLRSLVHSLPIRKVVFSNADKAHVAKVLGKLGLEDCFEGVICFGTLNTTTQGQPWGQSLKCENSPRASQNFESPRAGPATTNKMNTSDIAGSIGLSLSGTETFNCSSMREALPELWEAIKKSEVCYSEKTAIETPVRA
ncbi:uncharacterized protein LOC132269776 [Cornus florida]|uniref:uncharacterized protein LOC132269776 n=1 Tax=Cornus florida TaxID=4283 RepID=UPI00289F7978|nr:uncharacterized protein LOC132269776 [Cornus florida]